MKKTTTALALFLLAPLAVAAVPTGKYLMSFHACNVSTTDCNNPTNHNTYIAESNDGASWTVLTGFSTKQGSVPDIVRRSNKLYVYIPGRMTSYNLETNTWEATSDVSIRHADGTTEPFVDPSPIFDDNGYIVLFYLVSGTSTSGDPATCASTETSCTKVFRSATEIPGSDGTRFTVDSGNRAEITVVSSGNQRSASDPDIFAGPSGYVIYISRGMGVQVLTSSTLRGNYTNVTGLSGGMLVDGPGGIPAGHYDATSGQFWTYVTTNQTGGSQIIRRAVTTSLSTTIAESSFATVMSGAGVSALGSSFITASPGFLVNEVRPAIAGVSGSTSGLTANQTVSANVTIAAADVGRAGSFYVVALLNGSVYANNGSAWVLWSGGTLPTYSTLSAFASSHVLPILQNANLGGLRGLQIYAGYGTSLDDMLNNTKYGLVYTNVP